MTVQGQNCKYVAVIPPAAILDNTSAAEIEIDTLDYDYCEVILTLGASDIAAVAVKIQETDTTGSGEADVSGAAFGTDNDIDGVVTVLPSATDDNQVSVFQIDCSKRKRFLSLVFTAGNGSVGTFASAVARLSRGAVAETTSAGMADGGVIRV